MRCFLLSLVVLASCLARLHAESLNIYLINITIYQDHEADRLFVKNYPEVYLSCDDGQGKVNLDQVRRVKQLYQFRVGDIEATNVDEGGCVTCTLKESDSTALLKDDVFGSWSMCHEDFEETGFYEVEDPGEFLIVLQCPACVNTPPPVVAPASEPAEEEAPPSSEPLLADDEVGGDLEGSTYYTITFSEGTTANSVPEKTSEVVLQTEEEGDPERSSKKSSSGGTSAVTILSLCFTFLVVGIAVGVVLFWKYSAMVRNERRSYEAVELVKAGFAMKKANKS